MLDKFYLFIRKITIPSVFAIVFLLVTYFLQPALIGSPLNLILGIFFLGILPMLGYPLQKYIPYFKDKGRDGQRYLAMIFSAAGYLLGILSAFLTNAPSALLAVYTEYLLCGIAILVVNKLFHLKASGHSCGISGPVLLFLYFKMYLSAIIGTIFIIPVIVSSIKTKRHTAKQLFGGIVIAFCCMVIVSLIFGMPA